MADTIQLSTVARNGIANAIETAIGTAPLLRIRSGQAPANPAAARTCTVLATITMPSDWLADATTGTFRVSGGNPLSVSTFRTFATMADGQIYGQTFSVFVEA